MSRPDSERWLQAAKDACASGPWNAHDGQAALDSVESRLRCQILLFIGQNRNDLGRRHGGEARFVHRRYNHGLLFASEPIGRGSFRLGCLAPVLSSRFLLPMSLERPGRNLQNGTDPGKASPLLSGFLDQTCHFLTGLPIDLPTSFSSKRASTFF